MLTYENQSANMIVANSDRILPPGTSSLNKVNQQETDRRGCPITYRTENCGLKTSSYQFDVEQDPHMCTVNNRDGIAKKQTVKVTSSNAPLASHQGKSTVPVLCSSVASMPAIHVDKSTVFSSFYAEMEMTGNCTGLICDENSKHTGNPYSMSEKQKNDPSGLMEETLFEENHMDTPNNQVSTNSGLNNMQYSTPYNEIAALNQESTNMGLFNPRPNSGSWESSSHVRKENYLPISLPSDRSAIFSAKNMDLNSSQVSKSNIKLAKSPFLPLYNSVTSFHPTMSVESKTDRKSGISENTVSSIPPDKTVYYDDMEITKPTTCLKDNALKTAHFQDLPHQEMRTGTKSVTWLDSDKTVVFSLSDENEMEITKSCTVAVNHDMQQFEQVLQAPSLQRVDKTIYQCYNDMEETKPITCIIDQSLENIGVRAVPKPENEGGGRTLIDSTKDKTVVFSLGDENEMEITRSHTMAVNHEIVSHCEKTPQAPFVWNDLNFAGCHTVAKGNMHTNLVKLGTHAEREPSSNQMFVATADDMKTVKSLSVIDLNNQPASQAELAFALCKVEALESFQDNAEVANLPYNGNLVRSGKQNMSSKRIQESMENLPTSIGRGGTRDTIYGSNNNETNAEKWIPNSSIKLEVKSIPFLDDSMEMTKNYTTGIESMHTDAFKNECCLLSQEKLNSDLSTSVDPYGIKLSVDQDTLQNSINMIPSVSLAVVQEPQRSLKIKVEPYTCDHTNLSNRTASNALYHCERKGFAWSKETPNSKLTEETTLDLNSEKVCDLPPENLKNDPRKLSQLRQEDNCTGGTGSVLIDDKETKNDKTASFEQGSIVKSWQTNMNFPAEEKPQLSGIVNDCSKLNDSGNMPELVTMSQNIVPVPGQQSPRLIMKPEDPLLLKESMKELNTCFASNDMTNKSIMEDAPFSVPLTIIGQNCCQMTKLPLGIFPPKLPNRRKSAISNVEEIPARSGGRPENQDPENTLLMKKPSDKIMQRLSPSHYIDEELLPACAEEMDFSESLHYEGLEKPCNLVNEREIVNREGYLSEVVENNRQKRAWNQEDEELQKEKKFKVDDSWNDAARSKQPFSNSAIAHSHADEGKNVPDLRATNLERTQGSNSSSLDSLKADTDFSIQQNSEMEAQLFMDSISEQNLQEKLQEGVITVREFFTLLQVHVLIQKPRQSQLPPNYTVTTAPTPEDAILSQYVYRPKLQVYEEDCQILSDTIEELKQHVGDQDKPLVNVHKSLWEVMKTCSDEELKGFGAELNKMKSCFTKKSKVLAHRGKAKLYEKLVQNAQCQWEKLQSKLSKVDELIQKMDSCLIALKTETAKLESSELDLGDSLAEYESKLKDTENELKSCQAQEEALQREQSNLREQKQQRASEMTHLQENVKNCQELLKEYNFSEWVMKEWNDHQAVFTFLYDSIELTVALGCPMDDPVLSSKFCRKIEGVNFKSILDESKASPSSKLVHRLIFQFINKTAWQEKCSTVHHLYQMLHDISLVVSRCQRLGREIDFLDRWGGKFSLLKIEVNDMKVKLFFSSSQAFAKFEVELSLSASYPASPVVFNIPKCIGKFGQEEISAVLSSVAVGDNYLKRMVNQIHHNLLQQSPNSKDNQASVS